MNCGPAYGRFCLNSIFDIQKKNRGPFNPGSLKYGFPFFVPDLDKAALLARKEPILKKNAKERQGKRNDLDKNNIVPNLAQCEPGRVRDQLAQELGVSGK